MTALAPNARIACTRCGRPCRAQLTRLCRPCRTQLPRNLRPSLQPGLAHPTQQTGPNDTVNAAPPDDLQNGSQNIRPGSNFENTPQEIASVKQHIDERATDDADKANLTQTIFGRGK